MTCQIIYVQIVNIQQPREPETRKKVNFLSERTNILSKNPARKNGSKIEKESTF